MLPPFSMEITLVWSSSLIQTRNVLSLLCLVERRMNSFKAQDRPWKITLSILSFITVFQDCEEVKHCKIMLLCTVKDAVKLLSHLDSPMPMELCGFLKSQWEEQFSLIISCCPEAELWRTCLQTWTQLGCTASNGTGKGRSQILHLQSLGMFFTLRKLCS